MKNLFLILTVFFLLENNYSQIIDSTFISIDSVFISIDTIGLNISEDSNQIENKYQYRITFNKVFDGFNESFLLESLTDFFQSKVEYNKNLNQFTIVSTKFVDQSKFSKNFKQEIELFKRIPLITKSK